MRKLASIALGMIMVLALLAISTPAAAQEDTTAPVLVSIRIAYNGEHVGV